MGSLGGAKEGRNEGGLYNFWSCPLSHINLFLLLVERTVISSDAPSIDLFGSGVFLIAHSIIGDFIGHI